MFRVFGGSSFRASRGRYDLSSCSWSKSKPPSPIVGSAGGGRVLGGECNRASGGLMASRCKCSQSGTQATYPPTDALCQLTPYSLIILFSLRLLSLSFFADRVLYHTLSRAELNYFINPLFPGSFIQPSRLQGTKTTNWRSNRSSSWLNNH